MILNLTADRIEKKLDKPVDRIFPISIQIGINFLQQLIEQIAIIFISTSFQQIHQSWR